MRFATAVCLAVALAACAEKASKEEEEAAKNTFVCQFDGERLVIRFDAGEARMLMPSGDRVVLYQVPSTSGVRFSNGSMELRGAPHARQIRTFQARRNRLRHDAIGIAAAAGLAPRRVRSARPRQRALPPRGAHTERCCGDASTTP